MTILVNLGGNAAVFSAKLEDLLLKTTSASEILQIQKHKTNAHQNQRR